jgi:hypothetical protein
MLRLRSLTTICAAAAMSLLSPALAASAPAFAAGPGQSARVGVEPGLRTTAPAASGSNHSLNGISCPDAFFCMAVGNYDRGKRIPGLSEVLTAGMWTECRQVIWPH